MHDEMILIGRDEIATMIPHAGAMCLLDGVLEWDEMSIRCVSRRYQQPDNPMRRADGALGMASGIEIAAQAMALHARLAAGDTDRPSHGYLASVRDVVFAPGRLDQAPGDLTVAAARLSGDATGATYRFALTRGGAALLTGRATVILGIGA